MIIPSLDIFKNKVVRLYKGDIEKIKYFGYYLEYLKFYQSINIKKIHIVSLDNIFKKKKTIIKNTNIKIQIGGGINSLNFINFYNKKVNIFVLSSIIIKNKVEFKKIISFYKKKIIVSLDCKNLKVLINGWKSETSIHFNDIFEYLINIGIKTIIYTNTLKDGTLEGIDFKELNFLKKKIFLCKIIISGGISNYENIKKINFKKNFFFIIGISVYKFKINISNIL